jgi:hypothetical protein
MELKATLPLGIKVIIAFFLLSGILWTIGQGGAVVSYDRVAEWGLQEPRANLAPALVETHRGIGLADMIIQIPLFITAVIGLWQLRYYGAVVSWLAFGITMYWPIVEWCKHYFFRQAAIKYQPMDMATNGILAFILVFALWASWYLFKKRRMFR